MQLPSSKVVVLFTVTAATLRVSSLIRALRARFAREKSLPAIFSRLPARMTGWEVFFFFSEDGVLCFFCRHQRRRRLPYSPSLQSVQGRTPARGNRMFPPRRKGGGGWGASPPHSAYTRNRFFAYQPQATRRRKPSPMPFAYHCLLRRSRYKSCGVSRYKPSGTAAGEDDGTGQA